MKEFLGKLWLSIQANPSAWLMGVLAAVAAIYLLLKFVYFKRVACDRGTHKSFSGTGGSTSVALSRGYDGKLYGNVYYDPVKTYETYWQEYTFPNGKRKTVRSSDERGGIGYGYLHFNLLGDVRFSYASNAKEIYESRKQKIEKRRKTVDDILSCVGGLIFRIVNALCVTVSVATCLLLLYDVIWVNGFEIQEKLSKFAAYAAIGNIVSSSVGMLTSVSKWWPYIVAFISLLISSVLLVFALEDGYLTLFLSGLPLFLGIRYLLQELSDR